MPNPAPFLRFAGVGLIAFSLIHPAFAQDKPDNWLSRSQPAAVPAAPGGERQWSGQSGASGNPLMTADAIRSAAADFANCLAGLWPAAEQRGITRATFARYTEGLTPDLSIMDLLDAQPEFTKSTWDYLDLLVDDDRIARGREILTQYAPVFAAVREKLWRRSSYPGGDLGRGIQLRHHGRRPSDRPFDRDFGLRRPPPGLFS